MMYDRTMAPIKERYLTAHRLRQLKDRFFYLAPNDKVKIPVDIEPL